jgi:L-aspartate oxidase
VETLEGLRARQPPGAVHDAATAGLLIAVSALRRMESRGGHYRSDWPGPDLRQASRSRLDLATAMDTAREQVGRRAPVALAAAG